MLNITTSDATDKESLEKLVAGVDAVLADVQEPDEEDSNTPSQVPPEPDPNSTIEFDEALAEVALEVPDMAEALKVVQKDALFDEGDIRDAFLSLVLGHLLIAGPPGTGKTLLARRFAEAFGATLLESTANAEWSVYDVIGSERLRGDGTTEPRMGVVTNAVIECYSTIQKQIETDSGEQAVWLLIDEINRADIDRAFGALFTALSGDAKGQFTLDFVQPPKEVPIPSRFRIIATLNSYDTRFVNSMSAALRRRFSRVVIKPFKNDENNRIPKSELAIALKQAELTLAKLKGEQIAGQVRESLTPFSDSLAGVFGAFRSFSGNSGIPLGTAQIIDTCRFLFVLAAYGTPIDSEKEFWKKCDEAVAAKLTNSIESDASYGALDAQFPEEFAKAFGEMPKTITRIEAFLSGNE